MRKSANNEKKRAGVEETSPPVVQNGGRKKVGQKLGQKKSLSRDLSLYQEILEREREKSILLSLSEAIATIRDKDELWAVMMDKVQPLLEFKAAVSAVYSADYSQYRYLLFSGVITENLEQELKSLFNIYLPIAGTSDEWVLRQPEVCCLTIEEKEKRAQNNPAAIKILQAIGIRQNLYIKLKSTGKTIGVQHFHFESGAAIAEKTIALAKSITDLIATAVANILANEEILEREREKALLLELSRDLSDIRNRNEFWEVFNRRVRQIFPDSPIATLYVLDSAGRLRMLENTENAEREFYPYRQEAEENGSIKIAGTPFEKLLTLTTPYLRETAEWLAEYPDFWGLQYAKQQNINHIIFAALRYQGKLLGCWNLASRTRPYTEADFALFNAVTNQLSVTVANILANEEILEREREKSVLLSISEAIANVRDKDDLISLLLERVKSIIKFDDLPTVFVFDEKLENYSIFYSRLTEAESPETLDVWKTQKTPIAADPVAQFLIAQHQPITLPLKESELKWADHQGTKIARQLGYEEALHVPLQVGGKKIGILSFNAKHEGTFAALPLNIIQAIGEQIAVAVANILANEEIAALSEERRERAEELAKANDALARASERLTSLPNLEAFLSQVIIEAANQLHASAGHLVTYDETTDMLKTAVIVEGRKNIPVDELAAQMPAGEVGFFQILRQTSKPRYFSIEREADLFWAGSVEFLRRRNQKSVYAFPLLAGDKVLGVLGMAFLKENPVSERQVELVTALAHQAALAIQLTRLSDEASREAKQSATLAERNRIAREIHDTLAQGFTGVILQLAAAKRALEKNPAAVEERLEHASTLAREGLTEARRSVQALRPAALDNAELAEACEQSLLKITGQADAAARFNLRGKPFALDSEICTNLLRICQEAITNCLRHSGATRIEVELIYEPDNVVLQISDDGCGFDAAKRNDSGFGLRGMRERAAEIDAALLVDSRIGSGTRITVEKSVEPD